MKSSVVAAGILSLALASTTVLSAQLGDVARKEAERRKTVKSSGKTYTNDTLRADPSSSSAPASETFADALESRINALNTDFVNRDDPAQRAVIAADRDKAVAEMARLKKEVAQHTKAIADIQNEARRSGVPAGWVR
jgi:hypothetical protein